MRKGDIKMEQDSEECGPDVEDGNIPVQNNNIHGRFESAWEQVERLTEEIFGRSEMPESDWRDFEP